MSARQLSLVEHVHDFIASADGTKIDDVPFAAQRAQLRTLGNGTCEMRLRGNRAFASIIEKRHMTVALLFAPLFESVSWQSRRGRLRQLSCSRRSRAGPRTDPVLLPQALEYAGSCSTTCQHAIELGQ